MNEEKRKKALFFGLYVFGSLLLLLLVLIVIELKEIAEQLLYVQSELFDIKVVINNE
jgi:hypothetical protein